MQSMKKHVYERPEACETSEQLCDAGDNGRDTNINVHDTIGMTSLHLSSIHLLPRDIETLLINGADVNARNKYGATPLHYVVLHQRRTSSNDELLGFCQYIKDDSHQLEYKQYRDVPVVGNVESPEPGSPEHLDVVALLLRYAADVNAKDRNGRTPLLIAASLGYLGIVKCLVKSGASLHNRDICQTTALHEAARLGWTNIVSFLLSDEGAGQLAIGVDFMNVCDFRGETALFKAAEVGNCAAIEMLLKYGADVNACDVTGYSPLHIAAENADHNDDISKTVDCLLKSAADVHAQDLLRNTPLHLSHNTDVSTILIEYRADVNARNLLGRTPLHTAASRSWLKGVEILLTAGADPSLADEYGNTALHLIEGTKSEIVNLLVSCRPTDVNARNVQGLTPLHLRCIRQRMKLTESVINQGADCSVLDSYGVSPIYYLVRNIRPEELRCWTDGGYSGVKLLIDNNADCNSASIVNKKTPLHVACSNSEMSFKALRLIYDKTTDKFRKDSLGNVPSHYNTNTFQPLSCQDEGDHQHPHNRCGMTPYLIGTKHCKVIHKPCIVNDMDRMKRTALHVYCSEEPIGNICELTADQRGIYRQMINSRDALQRTPLHHMCIAKPQFIEELHNFEKLGTNIKQFMTMGINSCDDF